MNRTGKRSGLQAFSFMFLFCLYGPCSCNEESPLEILEFDVSPRGSVALCETISVKFMANAKSRYALTSGAQVLRAGLTQGLREEIRFKGDELSPEATSLHLTLAGVDGSEVHSSIDLTLDTGHRAPVSRPRLMENPTPGSAVHIDGSLSEDLDGDPITTYSWSIASGPLEARIDQSGDAMTTLQLPDEPSVVVVELTVTDVSGATDTRPLVVRTTQEGGNSPPLLEAPEVFEVRQAQPGERVEIEALASDPDGDPLHIEWQQSAGPLIESTISDDGTFLEFTAPDLMTLIVFMISVSDGIDETRSRLEVSVGDVVPDEPPTPSATLIDEPQAFVPVRISGEMTSDIDSEDLWFDWTLRRAPIGSLLGDDSIPGLSGWGADMIEVVFDRPGVYGFELRATDALGTSPTVANVSVDVRLGARQIAADAITDVVCRTDVVAWTGPEGISVRSETGQMYTMTTTASRAIAFSPSGQDIWFDATEENFGQPALSRMSIGPPSLMDEIMVLPDGPDQINAIVVDPAPTRLGDVYVGTDAGTSILDISDNICEGSVGLGCWVGAPSIGYLYQPPSRLGYASTEVDVLHVGLDEEGKTVVNLGNRYWLIRLERGDGEELVSQMAIDIFSDGQPQRITALATIGDDLFCGTEPMGLVRMGSDRECGYSDVVEQRCRRVMLDDCTLPATAAAPLWIADLAIWGEAIFIASADGLYLYDPRVSRFSQVVVSDEDFAGNPTSVAICEDRLFYGTSEGLWEIALEGEF